MIARLFLAASCVFAGVAYTAMVGQAVNNDFGTTEIPVTNTVSHPMGSYEEYPPQQSGCPWICETPKDENTPRRHCFLDTNRIQRECPLTGCEFDCSSDGVPLMPLGSPRSRPVPPSQQSKSIMQARQVPVPSTAAQAQPRQYTCPYFCTPHSSAPDNGSCYRDANNKEHYCPADKCEFWCDESGYRVHYDKQDTAQDYPYHHNGTGTQWGTMASKVRQSTCPYPCAAPSNEPQRTKCYKTANGVARWCPATGCDYYCDQSLMPYYYDPGTKANYFIDAHSNRRWGTWANPGPEQQPSPESPSQSPASQYPSQYPSQQPSPYYSSQQPSPYYSSQSAPPYSSQPAGTYAVSQQPTPYYSPQQQTPRPSIAPQPTPA